MSELSQPGVFTIDPQRALELMGEHLLPSKNHALLLWVQSAVLLGAGRIEFTVGRMGLSLAFVPQREIPELDLARDQTSRTQTPVASVRALLLVSDQSSARRGRQGVRHRQLRVR